MKNQNVLRNTFVSIGVLLALTQLLTAGTRERVPTTPLVSPHRTFATFDAPGGHISPSGINSAGAITGTYYMGSYPDLLFHSFLRTADGTFITIDPPGSTGAYVGWWYGLVGSPINAAGGHHGNLY